MAGTALVCVMSDVVSLTGKPGAAEDDAQLLALCRQGDGRAFRALYTRYKTDVYRVVAHMLSAQTERDDVVQEVFLQVFRSLPRFKGQAKLSTWIHRVAVNVVLQHIRKKKSRIQLQLQKDGVAPHRQAENQGTDDTPEQAMLLNERRAAVERALQCLSPKKRIAFILRELKGLSAKEIAEIVGAPVLTVRTRVFYARREFYRLLAAEPAFDDLDFIRTAASR